TELESVGEIPSEAALKDARTARDAVWTQLRPVVEGRGKAPAGLADGYEGRVQRADELADELRLQAAKVTAKTSYLEEKQRLSDQLEELRADTALELARELEAGKEWA